MRLQENAREVERELREDLDLAHAKIRETERKSAMAYEIIADHEATIQKFRGLVIKVVPSVENTVSRRKYLFTVVNLNASLVCDTKDIHPLWAEVL